MYIEVDNHWEMRVESLQLMKAPDLIIFPVVLFTNAQINLKLQHPQAFELLKIGSSGLFKSLEILAPWANVVFK